VVSFLQSLKRMNNERFRYFKQRKRALILQTHNCTCATRYESILTSTLLMLRPPPEKPECGEIKFAF
jgi:hypothetical protein